MEKTLGGDRLGAGNKMKVHLHNYERSTHDVGYVFRTTMSAGTLVPFMSEVALPGTTFDINLGCDVKTHPTIGPLFGSYKTQLDIFLCPIRLYNSAMHNNTLGIGRIMNTVRLPKIQMTAIGVDIEDVVDLDNSQINPSSLLPYLGIRGVGFLDASIAETQTRKFNAVPILAYYEIYKNYYANKQEEIGAVLHTPSVAQVAITSLQIATPPGGLVTLPPDPTGIAAIALTTGSVFVLNFAGATPIPSQHIVKLADGRWINLAELSNNWVLTAPGVYSSTYKFTTYGSQIAQTYKWASDTDINTGKPAVATFTLANIDMVRQLILASPPAAEWLVNDANIEPYKWLYEQPNGVPNVLSSQEGLALKTYQSDQFNNWLKTENIEAISTATAIDTTSGSFTIDAFIISKKVWQMLNRINVSGGSYDDWMDAVYVHDRYKSQESPMYMGGLIKELVFQEVVSNSATIVDGGQPLGTLAGKGTMSGKHKGGTVVVHVDEPSYIIGIVSLTPRIDYSQGNKWDVNLNTMDDFHKPALDEIGFQELITEGMAWWDTTGTGTTWVQRSAGKQPAWLNYMTNVNRVYGNFAIPDNEMFMTLNRRYEVDNPDTGPGIIGDLTTYIDPSKFNFIFAETSLDAQNFWVQIGVDITARRKMSGKLMPNL